jgi:hypothetical protein
VKTQKLIESAIDKSDNAGVDEQDLKELIEDYQALPAGERPKAIEALVYRCMKGLGAAR